ncbi:MAG: BlaI/MecI/CopY family transcriptional regulator [Planctomycetota bacterium]
MPARQDITETELAVLKVLWQDGERTAREITEAIYPDCTTSDIGTVHSLLKRLEQKKLVRRSRRTHPHRFSAKVGIEEVAGRQLEAMAVKLSDGSMAPFLSHLLSAGKLSRDDAREIREMLKNYKPSEE